MLGVGNTSEIADALARSAGRPVLDGTAIEGRFGWALHYDPVSSDTAASSTAAIFSLLCRNNWG